MADHLSDKERRKFNSWIKDSNGVINSKVEQNKIKNKQKSIEQKIDEIDKKDVSEQNAQLQLEKENYKKELNSITGTYGTEAELTNGKSLFDKNALIDYGRYVRSKPWVEWNNNNKDGIFDSSKENYNSNQFEPNNAVVLNKLVKDEEKEEITIGNLIEWSERYPALQLRYQDFIYCKKLNFFPNNRLIVLRRFKEGVPDNLFDHIHEDISRVQPISTMVTWLQPNEHPVVFNFKENWENNTIGGLADMINHVVGDNTNNSKIREVVQKLTDVGETLLPLVKEIFGTSSNYRRIDGIRPSDMGVNGDPNLINSSSTRIVPATGRNGMEGKLTFEMSFDYELRYINDVDPSIAMIDLISNALRMGTSSAKFRYPYAGLINDNVVKEITIQKDFQITVDKIVAATIEIGKQAVEGFKDTVNALANGKLPSTEKVKEKTGEVLTTAARLAISRYREQIKAAFAADTGSPSGIWHVTIGNPKKPIISCGDLIIQNSEVTMSKELGFNDFPIGFTCKIKVGSARDRGRDELERIFNAGRGRVYVYAKPHQNPDNFMNEKDFTQGTGYDAKDKK